MRFFSVLALFLAAGAATFAQPVTCTSAAMPPLIHYEGLTERVGDIVLTCTGTPNNMVNANITISMNATITNRLTNGSQFTGLVFTTDSGSGPQPVVTPPLDASPNALAYNGVPLTFSAQGKLNLTFAGIRINATQLSVNGLAIASISINNAGLALASSHVTVGTAQRSLYANDTYTLVSSSWGSVLPDAIDFLDLVNRGTAFATTRLTEGYADALQPLAGWTNLNADSGERILIQYSGFPDGARLFVPDVIVGSDGVQPTSAGDFGLPVSGGVYAPSSSGSLLLTRVQDADASGAAGIPVYHPGPGSSSVQFGTVSELSLVNGTAYVVYEVVDANPAALEYATLPVFLGLTGDGSRESTDTSEKIFLAPSSNVATATSTDPIPRFAPIAPTSDCGIVGDCDASPPQLSVSPSALVFSASQGVNNYLSTNITVQNSGGGVLRWNSSMKYTNGSGWLTIDPYKGYGNATPQVWVGPRTLAPGAYTGTLTIDAGVGGAVDIPVTFNLTAPPAPAVTSVVNAASFLSGPAAPGSLATVMGTLFNGSNVSATFDSQPATILFSNATQINLLVPQALAGQSSAKLVVTVDGVSSAPFSVNLAPFQPAIFSGGIANQDGSANSSTNGAEPGSVIAIWATGLSGNGVITGNIGGIDIDMPYYAGPAPGIPGVQQVNLQVPGSVAPGPSQVYLCGTPPGGSPTCSVPVPLAIQ